MQVPPSWKVVAFTVNLILGLAFSQGFGAVADKDTYNVWAEIVSGFTMWCLSYIMINVGYEFTIDKGNLPEYAWDYVVAMTAAGFPWLFVALWIWVAVGDLPMEEALLIARFAAPTSAGILFSMLEGAGLKETWLFSKARILAIFDDLDTIILMIPLKIVLVGFKWELLVVIAIMVTLLVVAWVWLHNVRLPQAWHWTLFYAAIIAAVCKVLHHFTHHSGDMEAIHIEVLLPAFVLGCIIDTPEARHELKLQRQASMLKKSRRESTATTLSKGGSSSALGWMPENEKKMADTDLLRTTSKKSTTSNNAIVSQELPPGCVMNHEDSHPSTQDDSQVEVVVDTTLIKHQVDLQPEPEPLKQPADHKVDHCSTASSADISDPGLKGPAWVDPGEKAGPLADVDEHAASNHHADHIAQTTISLVFMVLVGLSMPRLVGPHREKSDMPAGEVIGHIVMVSILMVIGKMFPTFCYRDETDIKARFALSLGLCPRGEVGASIIVISIDLGVKGPAVVVAMGALAVNLVLSGGFIAAVKYLLRLSSTSKEEEVMEIKLQPDNHRD